VLLYDGPLLCGFNVAIKGFKLVRPTEYNTIQFIVLTEGMENDASVVSLQIYLRPRVTLNLAHKFGRLITLPLGPLVPICIEIGSFVVKMSCLVTDKWEEWTGRKYYASGLSPGGSINTKNTRKYAQFAHSLPYYNPLKSTLKPQNNRPLWM